MARTTAQRFYMRLADHDGAWGTDVRAALSPNPGGTNFGNSQNNHGTGTGPASYITFDPFTISTTVGDRNTLFGWAINRDAASDDGMDSIAGARRIIPAGTWAFRGRINIPIAGTGTGSITVSLNFRAYRVSSDGLTRTQLFSATTPTAASSGLAAANDQDLDASIVQPVIVLEPGETLHFSVASSSAQVAGLLGATVQQSIVIQHANLSWFEVPAPGIRTRYEVTPAGTLTLASASVGKLIKRLLGSLSGMTGTVQFRATQSLASTLLVSGTVLKNLQRRFTGSTSASGVLSRRLNRTFTGTVTPGPSSIQWVVRKTIVATLGPAGTLMIKAVRFWSGSVAPAGALQKMALRRYTGTLTSSAILRRQANKTLTATITPTSTVTSVVRRFFTGTLAALAGVMRKTIQRPRTASIAPSGAIIKRPAKFLSGSVASSSTHRYLPIKRLTATITPVATASFRLFLVRTGSLAPTGLLRKKTNKGFAGFFYSSGSTGGGDPVVTIIKKVITYVFDD